MVFYQTLISPWFNTVTQDKKLAIVESFKEVVAWVDSKIVLKIKALSQM